MRRARSNRPRACPYVTKGGAKLAFALCHFGVDPRGATAADLGCHKGGFTDCLLVHGARRVYVLDTAFGILDWRLRNDARVVVHERTNLLHWRAPEPLDLITVDAGWTPLCRSIPAALASLGPEGVVLALAKPQYEADRDATVAGVLRPERIQEVMGQVRRVLEGTARILGEATSPIPGSGGNTEVWLYLTHA